MLFFWYQTRAPHGALFYEISYIFTLCNKEKQNKQQQQKQPVTQLLALCQSPLSLQESYSFRTVLINRNSF